MAKKPPDENFGKFFLLMPTSVNFCLLPRPPTCFSDNQQRQSHRGHRLDSMGFFQGAPAQPFTPLDAIKAAVQHAACAQWNPPVSNVKATRGRVGGRKEGKKKKKTGQAVTRRSIYKCPKAGTIILRRSENVSHRANAVSYKYKSSQESLAP